MNDKELRILGDHYSKGRRILLEEHLAIEFLLNESISDLEKVARVKKLLVETTTKLNIQQKVYNQAMYGQSE